MRCRTVKWVLSSVGLCFLNNFQSQKVFTIKNLVVLLYSILRKSIASCAGEQAHLNPFF
jgi:hypothetical protein